MTKLNLFMLLEKSSNRIIKINENASHIFEKTSINPDLFKVNGRTIYNFELSDEDIKTQTLIKYGNVYQSLCRSTIIELWVFDI